jgi:hypothetical protein
MIDGALGELAFAESSGAAGDTITGAGDIASVAALGQPTLDTPATAVLDAGQIVSVNAFGGGDVIWILDSAGNIASVSAFGGPTIFETFTYRLVSRLN